MTNHKTQVTVRYTNIKMVDESNNDAVTIVDVNGKLTLTDAKNHAKEMGLTFISKEDKKDFFFVDTNALKALKTTGE